MLQLRDFIPPWKNILLLPHQFDEREDSAIEMKVLKNNY